MDKRYEMTFQLVYNICSAGLGSLEESNCLKNVPDWDPGSAQQHHGELKSQRGRGSGLCGRWNL